jgi:acyl transferase domain-containing protein/acyl carrier protein
MSARQVDVERLESWLRERVAERLKVEPGAVDPERTFDSFGLGSSDAVTLSGDLEAHLGRELEPTLAYEHPTIRAMARFLCGDEAASATAAAAPSAAARPGTSGPVAVVGMACRFPGDATGVDELWRMLAEGRDAASTVPADRWNADDYLDPDPTAPGKAYTQSGGFLRDLAGFDAQLFGLPPAEALRMDPQQRLLLELAWAALEDAGLAPDRLRGTRTGVFVGLMDGMQYAQLQLECAGPELLNDPFFAMGAAASVAAGRIAYLLDLRGPALPVDTACSSSLVSTHLAVRSLRAGECDLALAGGASSIAHPHAMVQACKMGMLARDGRCKTFDRDADGFLLGEGSGLVVLERLEDAVAAGHPVHAVIEGSAVNQDGRSNGLNAPSRAAQAAVIRAALADAGVEPDAIDFVEAHGSGTQLGDAIEVSALRDVFRERPESLEPVRVGSIKTNLGHLQGASGIAGLLKAVLAVRNGELPRTLHLSELNPALKLDGSPLAAAVEHSEWPRSMRPRRASVSSFGWSGTNAHAVVRAAPGRAPAPPEEELAHILPLSAASPTALAEVAARLRDRLIAPSAPALRDVAFTMAMGRSALPIRRALVCRDSADAARQLARLDPAAATTAGSDAPRVAFAVPDDDEEAHAHAELLRRWGVTPREDAGDAHVLIELGGDRASLLCAAAELWERGSPIAWEAVFEGSGARRVRLPTYPFQRTRFWPARAPLDGAGPSAAPASAPAQGGKRPDLADWCSAPVWRDAPIDPTREPPDGPWLVLDDGGPAQRAADTLRAAGQIVTVVAPGERLDVNPGGACTIEPRTAGHYRDLLAALSAAGVAPAHAIHGLTARAPAVDPRAAALRDVELGFESLLLLAQALAVTSGTGSATELLVASTCAADLPAERARLQPARAMFASLCRCLSEEQSTLLARHVDVSSEDLADGARQLLAELALERRPGTIAWRGERRLERGHDAVRVEPAAKPVWRERGTYMITGGTGGLGLVLAKHLAETKQARLVLTGRTALPDRDEWERRLEQAPEGDSDAERIRALLELERLGAEVMVASADVADPAALSAVVVQAKERFGALHGVVHAAGVPGSGMFQRKSLDDAAAVLRPKVLGTLALAEALRGERLDFLALYSSSAAVLGGLGESDYAAANAFMDAWAATTTAHGAHPTRVVAIGWGAWVRDSWQERLFAEAPELARRVRDYRDRLGIADDEGVELLTRVLASPHPSVMVLPQDADATLRAIAAVASAAALVAPAPRQLFPRPDLRCAYSPPRTERERALARIWSEQLGIDRIGIDDPFFELGGSSLIGLSILARIERELGAQLLAGALFERPTVRELAQLIDGDQPEEDGGLDDQSARGERRRRFAAAARRRGAPDRVAEL